MGFFDKRSRQFRRKIKDLQAELKAAEKSGKYVVERGLFFAELEEMGDATMISFSAGDLASSAEEDVVRAFFDRNGFTVEELKTDRSKTEIIDVEIIPPREIIMAIGRELKADGYRMVDDSENERPADLAARVYPLTAVVRVTSLLLAQQVERIISKTNIKFNKEGNRLLHWLPKIEEYLRGKLPEDVIHAGFPVFHSAFERFYGEMILTDQERQRLGEGGSIQPEISEKPRTVTEQIMEMRSKRVEAMPDEDAPTRDLPSMQPDPNRATPKPPPPSSEAAPSVPTADIFNTGAASSSSPTTGIPQPPSSDRIAHPATPQSPFPEVQKSHVTPQAVPIISDPSEVESDAPALQISDKSIRSHVRALETQSAMYRDLVKANASRCVKNAEKILAHVNTLFEATSTCLMVKMTGTENMTIYAQAGKKLVWGEEGAEGYAVSKSVVAQCIQQQKVTTSEAAGGDPSMSMAAFNIESTMAGPIMVEGELAGVLYLDRRGGLRPFKELDQRMMPPLLKVFETYPDLTLGLLM